MGRDIVKAVVALAKTYRVAVTVLLLLFGVAFVVNAGWLTEGMIHRLVQSGIGVIQALIPGGG